VGLRPVTVPGGIGAHKWRDRRLLADLSAGPGAGEQALLVDGWGDVLGTDRGNGFAGRDRGGRPPPPDGPRLPAGTRPAVLRLAGELGIPVKEAPLPLDALAGAAEAFVTNSVQGIVAVRSLSGPARTWPPGPVTGRLRAAAARMPGPVAPS